jgi:hypothetical protein
MLEELLKDPGQRLTIRKANGDVKEPGRPDWFRYGSGIFAEKKQSRRAAGSRESQAAVLAANQAEAEDA